MTLHPISARDVIPLNLRVPFSKTSLGKLYRVRINCDETLSLQNPHSAIKRSFNSAISNVATTCIENFSDPISLKIVTGKEPATPSALFSDNKVRLPPPVFCRFFSMSSFSRFLWSFELLASFTTCKKTKELDTTKVKRVRSKDRMSVGFFVNF